MLLANAGIAMGIQAATIRQLGEISTTYLTGTLTGVISALVTGRKPEGLERSLGIFAAVIVGACASRARHDLRARAAPGRAAGPAGPGRVVASARFGPRPRHRDRGQPGRRVSPPGRPAEPGLGTWPSGGPRWRRSATYPTTTMMPSAPAGGSVTRAGQLVAPAELEEVRGEQHRDRAGKVSRQAVAVARRAGRGPAAQHAEQPASAGHRGQQEQRARACSRRRAGSRAGSWPARWPRRAGRGSAARPDHPDLARRGELDELQLPVPHG